MTDLPRRGSYWRNRANGSLFMVRGIGWRKAGPHEIVTSREQLATVTLERLLGDRSFHGGIHLPVFLGAFTPYQPDDPLDWRETLDSPEPPDPILADL